MKQALSRCGFRKLHVSAADHTVELDVRDATGCWRHCQRLCGGRGAQPVEAERHFEGVGCRERRSGLQRRASGAAWMEIGIDSYDSANAPFTRIVELENAAVSTSGDTEQHLDAGGVRYSHIINPQTGVGLTSPLTVTVIARHGIDADAMATAISVLGLGRGRDVGGIKARYGGADCGS